MIHFNPSAYYAHEPGMLAASLPAPRLQFNIITDDPAMLEQLVSLLHPLDTGVSSAVEYFDGFDSLLEECRLADSRHVIFVQMEKPGFFNFLKQLDRSNAHVIAMINGSGEEMLAARLLELHYVVKQQISAGSLRVLLERVMRGNKLF